LVSFYWTSQVISTVVHVTVAGVVASWYFLYPHAMPPSPTTGALKRATWNSFGSICLGSFVVAIIRAMRALVQEAASSGNSCARCVALCLLGCLDSLVTFFNTYAFTEVAICGKDYCSAARDTWHLLMESGLTLIINDNLIGGVVAFACFMGGLVGGVVGGVMSYYVFELSRWVIWAVVGFLLCLATTSVAMETVYSGTCALFVCFAEDPAALHQTKIEVYMEFQRALSGHPAGAQVRGFI